MDTHITACPHCGTRFRVTQAQLSQARGRVRCGNCLEAFQATDGLGTVNAPLLVDESLINDANRDAQAAAGPNNDHDHDHHQERASQLSLQNSDSQRQIPDASVDLVDENNSIADTPDHIAAANRASPAAVADMHNDDPRAEIIDTHDLYIDLPPRADDDATEDDDANAAALAPMTQPRRYGWLWGSLSLILLLLLAAQYLTYNVKSQATNPMLRPLYTQACQLLDCQLPSPIALDQLSASNLMIRSITQQPGVLLVDLLLYNGASWPQPFPRLKLMFSGLRERPVAAGIFVPDDYLGRLDDMQKMPPHQQVHISFRITDPGKAAINYSLKLLVPDHA